MVIWFSGTGEEPPADPGHPAGGDAEHTSRMRPVLPVEHYGPLTVRQSFLFFFIWLDRGG